MLSIADGLGLLIGVVVIATIADRLRIAYPILLVIVGVVVALIPIHHRVQLPPELILLVFLPPLIYDASLETSARELRAHLRPILLLAVGLVLATMVAVAVVIHTLVGGMSWPVALALGAIVSPPDSIAATQIAGKLGLPRRLVTILGGEGLMNDATALTAYQLAIAAVGTTVTVIDVFGRFVFAVVAGVAIGLVIGWVASRMLRLIETPVIENTMLLVLPFAAYLPADKIGASGVLAVVAAGLYFGRYGSSSLTAAARLQQREIWDLFVFLLSGLSFLLVGLELRPVLDSLTNRESGSLVVEALAVVGVVMLVRLVWMFGAAALPGGRRLLGADPNGTQSWRETTVVGWSGMRGAVSLAAALALPSSFPDRDLLVFLTFAVIVATLVGQGLTLPPLIRRLGLVTQGEQDAVVVARAQRRLTVIALSQIDDLQQSGRFPPDLVERLRIGYELQLSRLDRRIEVAVDRGDGASGAGPSSSDGVSSDGVSSDGSSGEGSSGEGSGGSDRAGDAGAHLQTEQELRRTIIDAERGELHQMLIKRKISQRVAESVRSSLDRDETTMRP